MPPRRSQRLALAAFLFAAPVVARGDVVWPALVLLDGIYKWWVIAAGLLVEWPVVRYLTRRSWRDSFLLNFGMNLASAVVGVVLIPLGGGIVEFVPELVFGLPTFHAVTWLFAILFATAANAFIEGHVMRLATKQPLTGRVYSYLLMANLVTVATAVAALLMTPGARNSVHWGAPR